MSFFRTPEPKPPPQIPPTPSPESQIEAKEAASGAKRRKGHGRTIATSGLGLPGSAPTYTPSLG